MDKALQGKLNIPMHLYYTHADLCSNYKPTVITSSIFILKTISYFIYLFTYYAFIINP